MIASKASRQVCALTKLNRKVARRVALVTSLALLFAQYGALAHAYSHLHSSSNSTYVLDAHGKQCAECLTFAPLLAAAGAPASEPVHCAAVRRSLLPRWRCNH